MSSRDYYNHDDQDVDYYDNHSIATNYVLRLFSLDVNHDYRDDDENDNHLAPLDKMTMTMTMTAMMIRVIIKMLHLTRPRKRLRKMARVRNTTNMVMLEI